MSAELCLGTAALGMRYGITNEKGELSRKESNSILEYAASTGIKWLDTAPSYGCAESLIGEHKEGGSFNVITKFACREIEEFKKSDCVLLDNILSSSLSRMRRSSAGCLLLHSSEDLAKKGSTVLRQWLRDSKASGLVERVGISIYDRKDVELIDRETFDIIQLPLSIYNQALIHDGTIENLVKNGYAVHARSIFLQGLLLTEGKKWPQWTGTKAQEAQMNLEKIANSMSKDMLELSIDFIKSQDYLELVIVGATSSKELEEITNAWKDRRQSLSSWGHLRSTDQMLIDPRRWPHRG